MLLSAAVLLGLAVVSGTWIYQNVVLVLKRLHATKDLPDPQGGHPLLGHLLLLLAKPMTSFRVFHEWAKTYGPVYRVRFLWRPVVVVTDPGLYQPLLRPGPAKLQKYTAPYKMFEVFVKPPLSNMLSSAETPVWRSARRAAVAALTMNNLRLCFPHITAIAQRLIDSLAAAGPEAVQDMDLVAQQITVDIIGMAAFDRDLEATMRRPQQQHNTAGSSSSSSSSSDSSSAYRGVAGRGPEVLEVMRHLVVAMQSRNNPLNRWFPWRKAYRDLMYWGGRMSDLVVDLTADMEACPPPPHSLGAHMLACKHHDTGLPLERMQIMAELGVLWGAGFETTAHTICWTLLLVATHPQVEQRLLAELDSMGLLVTPGQPQPGQLKWEHLAQLRYLSAVINESMRLYPVVSSGTIRITHQPISLGPYGLLPAGQPVLIPFFAIHRSPRLWEDPDAFRPERWLGANEVTPAATVGAPGSGPDAAAAAGGGGGGGGGDDASSAAGASAAAPATAAAGVTAASPAGCLPPEDDDYVDVAADISCIRDQDAQQQQQQQQQQDASGGKACQGSSSASKQPPAAVPWPVKHSSSGLEIKDPSVSRCGFLPFSEGRRNCVGQSLALVELKAVLAMLLGNFSFRLIPEMGGLAGVYADACQAITLRPEHGLMMTLRHRSLG